MSTKPTKPTKATSEVTESIKDEVATTTKPPSQQSKKDAAKTSGSAESRRAKLQAQREALLKKEKQRRFIMYGIGALAVLLVVAIIAYVVWRANQPTKIEGAPPNATVKADGINPYPGKAKPGAPTVALYADFQCPGCASLENALGKELFELAQSGDIVLENRTLIMLDDKIPGRHSLRSAVAAACGDKVGMYPDVVRGIFAFQPPEEGQGFTDAILTTQVAELVKMTPEQQSTYTACYNEAITKDFVTNVDKQGRKSMFDIIGKVSTPLIAVNGKALDLTKLKLDAADKKAMLMEEIGKVK